MTPFRSLLTLLCTLALGGCAAISSLSEAAAPFQAYELRAPASPPAVRGSIQRDLVIEAPSTGGALDTDRILIRPDPFQVAYLPGARWTDPAPVMLQNLMVRSLEDTNALRFVGRQPLLGAPDFLLSTELTDFQIELGPEADVITTRVRLTARIVREQDGRITGSRTIQQTATAASLDPAAVIASFDQATTAALQELTVWSLRQMGVGVSP